MFFSLTLAQNDRRRRIFEIYVIFSPSGRLANESLFRVSCSLSSADTRLVGLFIKQFKEIFFHSRSHNVKMLVLFLVFSYTQRAVERDFDDTT